MAPASLKEMCRRTTVRNIRKLDTIGAIPVELVNNIINRIDNAPQLFRLEQNSPQVVGSSGVREAYLLLLKRDIPNLDARMPQEWSTTLFAPGSEHAPRWHKIYAKLKRQVDKERNESNARMAKALGGLRQENERTIDIVDKKPTRATGMSYKAASWNLNKDMYGKGSGLGFFEKMNRNAMAKKRAGMRTATHKLSEIQRTPVFKAPLSLVEDAKARREMQENQKKISAETQKRKRDDVVETVGRGPLHAPGAIKEREERLKRLKAGNSDGAGRSGAKEKEVPATSRLTVEDLEGSDDDESDAHEDLFGEATSSRPNRHSPEKATKPLNRSPPLVKTGSSVPANVPANVPAKSTIRRRHEATLFRPVKR